MIDVHLITVVFWGVVWRICQRLLIINASHGHLEWCLWFLLLFHGFCCLYCTFQNFTLAREANIPKAVWYDRALTVSTQQVVYPFCTLQYPINVGLSIISCHVCVCVWSWSLVPLRPSLLHRPTHIPFYLTSLHCMTDLCLVIHEGFSTVELITVSQGVE